MFTLPTACDDTLTEYQGKVLQGYSGFENFTIVWCGEPFTGTMTKGTMSPKHVFVLRKKKQYKWVYQDDGGFFEILEKWYSKSFLKLNFTPSENNTTMKVKNAFVELPYYPPSYFSKLFASKKRKRYAQIQTDVMFPTWQHLKNNTRKVEVAKSFKDMFSRADAHEIQLKDPFEGYDNLHDIMKNKTGKVAYMTIAGFVYHHCRDNLGYPISQ